MIAVQTKGGISGTLLGHDPRPRPDPVHPAHDMRRLLQTRLGFIISNVMFCRTIINSTHTRCSHRITAQALCLVATAVRGKTGRAHQIVPRKSRRLEGLRIRAATPAFFDLNTCWCTSQLHFKAIPLGNHKSNRQNTSQQRTRSRAVQQ